MFEIAAHHQAFRATVSLLLLDVSKKIQILEHMICFC